MVLQELKCLANFIKRTLKENTDFKIILPMVVENDRIILKIKYRQPLGLYLIISDKAISISRRVHDCRDEIFELSNPESLTLALSETLSLIDLYCGAVDRSAITECDQVDEYKKEYAKSLGETYTTDLEEFLKRHTQDNNDYFKEPIKHEEWEDNSYLTKWKTKRPKKNTWASISIIPNYESQKIYQ